MSVWKLKHLISHCGENSCLINGKWVPSRPINYQYLSLIEKIKDAWEVFRGKAEAFYWEE